MLLNNGNIPDVYVIRDDNTGLFSRGGAPFNWQNQYILKWSRHGKCWSSIGHLKNHFYSAISYLPGRDIVWEERQTKHYKLSSLLERVYPNCSVVKLGPNQSNEVTPLSLWCEQNNWPAKYRGE